MKDLENGKRNMVVSKKYQAMISLQQIMTSCLIYRFLSSLDTSEILKLAKLNIDLYISYLEKLIVKISDLINRSFFPTKARFLAE